LLPLPLVSRGFVRIRHFGFLASRTRRATLARCRTFARPVSVAARLIGRLRSTLLPMASAHSARPSRRRRLCSIACRHLPVMAAPWPSGRFRFMGGPKSAGAAKALVDFFRTPKAVAVIKAQGMEPAVP
jgi:hypothetical protein